MKAVRGTDDVSDGDLLGKKMVDTKPRPSNTSSKSSSNSSSLVKIFSSHDEEESIEAPERVGKTLFALVSLGDPFPRGFGVSSSFDPERPKQANTKLLQPPCGVVLVLFFISSPAFIFSSFWFVGELELLFFLSTSLTAAMSQRLIVVLAVVVVEQEKRSQYSEGKRRFL